MTSRGSMDFSNVYERLYDLLMSLLLEIGTTAIQYFDSKFIYVPTA